MYLRSVTLSPEHYPTDAWYPFNQAVFRETHRFDFRRPVTIFVGENGTGKSTLLEALAYKCGLPIWRNPDRDRVVKNPYEKRLQEYLTLDWVNGPVPGSFFGSDIFRTFAESLDDWAEADPGLLKYFGGHSLLTQSHGQSLMSFFAARYRIKGLYLLDEPETALSPRSQVLLVQLLREAAEAGHAQFIVATHSPLLLSCPGAQILSFDHVPVKEVACEDTDHHRLYAAFFRDPAAFLAGENTP